MICCRTRFGDGGGKLAKSTDFLCGNVAFVNALAVDIDDSNNDEDRFDLTLAGCTDTEFRFLVIVVDTPIILSWEGFRVMGEGASCCC
jgi:hypothetical protein